MIRDQRGAGAVEGLLLMGFSLVFVCAVFNLGAWVLLRDVAASAVDQGVRAGAREDVDAVGACAERGTQVLGNLARDAGATLSCSTDGEVVRAVIHLPLHSWFPGLPDASTNVSASARKEMVVGDP